MGNGLGEVSRILYKEIVPGDLRKILAESNDSKTGGGARDFRFGSYSELRPAVQQMFPRIVQERRRRNGVIEDVGVFAGEFSWRDSDGRVIRKESFFEPPTDARPSEGRIVRVPDYACFDTSLIPSGGMGNRVLLLLIQLQDDSVWPYFVEERTLSEKGKWHAVVAHELLSCLNAKRRSGLSVIGYRDFATEDRYCNGK